ALVVVTFVNPRGVGWFGINDEPVGGGAERRGQPALGPDVQRRRGDGQNDERDDGQHPYRNPPAGHRRRASSDIHWEPPFRGTPRGSLARASGPREQVIDVVGAWRPASGLEPLGEFAF